MKKNLLILALISLTCISQVNATWTNKTMLFGGVTRSYRVYQSANYNASNPASLLIALHGLGDNMTNFSGIGFNHIADTANIICIFPQALTDALLGSSAWNSGAGMYGYYPNSTIDDIGFINAIVDTAEVNYSIDTSHVYLCGFSMGGFMTERMAAQSNLKFAAFAAMSGTLGNEFLTPSLNFNPGRHVPIAEFHGTSDSTVYYHGNLYGLDPDSLIHLWAINNGCTNYASPTTSYYPNIANDGINIELYEYSNGTSNSDVWFFKMNNCTHTVLFKPSNDINEPVEVWLFLRWRTHSITGITEHNGMNGTVSVFPNPTSNKVTIAYQSSEIPQNTILNVYNIQGQLMLQQTIEQKTTEIDMNSLPKGVYLLKVSSDNSVTVRRIVKE